MNTDPTAPTVLAAFLAGNDSFDVYAEDGSIHVGTIVRAPRHTDGAADCVMTLEAVNGPALFPGRFLIAVRRLDEDSPADVAVANAGGTL